MEWKAKIDLRPKYLQKLQALAQETLPAGTEVWLYGSRAKGTSYEGSDIDLLLSLPETLLAKDCGSKGLLRSNDFAAALVESNIPYLCQVFRRDRVPSNFLPEIDRCKVLLYTVRDNGHKYSAK